MSDFLKTMASSSAVRASEVDSGTVKSVPPVVPLQLGQFDIIAEIKERSPSEGELGSPGIDRGERALRYAVGGAAAISVLTEPSQFGGAIAHLAEVVAAVPDTPVMRKDFLVDPVQVVESRNAGASGVLLIVTMLSDAKLGDMLACAFEHGMFVLLESFDAQDLRRTSGLLERASHQDRARSGQLLAGVNTRNLRTLDVDNARLEQLAPSLPSLKCVAESGMHTANDAAAAAALGYRLGLVGSALMRSDDPSSLVADMRAAGGERVAA